MTLSLSFAGGFTINYTQSMFDDDYNNDSMEIITECFSNDFDEVGWDPIEVDDSNEEAKELFGY